MRANMYDKAYLTGKEIRQERQRLKAFQVQINQHQIKRDLCSIEDKKRGPLVRPLTERIEKFKNRIMKRPEKYKVMFGNDISVLKRNKVL